MTASLLNGKFLAALRQNELKQNVHNFVQKYKRTPGLAVILIGQDIASSIYVRNKRKACEEVGIRSYSYDLPEETSQEALLKLVEELNLAPHVDGILIQLPLPKHIEESIILEHIRPEKDVDGFHPYNIGRLAQRNPLLRPCTPMGIVSLLQHYQLDMQGKHAVVIGASNIVGRPMGLELLLLGATVTVCHRFTKNLQALVEMADVIVVAAGKMDLVHPEWLQKKHIILDVGIHRLEDGSIRGDINFKEAAKKVAWITPVPGGIGPMTIISLLENTLMAAQSNLG